MSESPIDRAFERVAYHLRTAPDDFDAAVVAAANELTEDDDAADDLIDELRDGLWDRINETEIVDSWQGHMVGSGSRGLGILELDSRSAFVVGIANDDDVFRLRVMAEYSSREEARRSLPTFRDDATEM